MLNVPINSRPDTAALPEQPGKLGCSRRATTRGGMISCLEAEGYRVKVGFNGSGPLLLVSRTGNPPFYGVTVPVRPDDDHAEAVKRLRRMVRTMEKMRCPRKS